MHMCHKICRGHVTKDMASAIDVFNLYQAIHIRPMSKPYLADIHIQPISGTPPATEQIVTLFPQQVLRLLRHNCYQDCTTCEEKTSVSFFNRPKMCTNLTQNLMGMFVVGGVSVYFRRDLATPTWQVQKVGATQPGEKQRNVSSSLCVRPFCQNPKSSVRGFSFLPLPDYSSQRCKRFNKSKKSTKSQ